ncbi:hypothetical protein [Actinomadura sp. NEAU-AAG7]|nr:hypothetical protein [Actinomadura sp. NEAU-AAG7]MBT2207716.1 hypothetical protein [Actinomadura sp. NEAU-AAG7]
MEPTTAVQAIAATLSVAAAILSLLETALRHRTNPTGGEGTDTRNDEDST